MTKCFHCGAAGAKLRCSRCRTAAYCGADCQRADWKGHKKVCVKKSKSTEVPTSLKHPCRRCGDFEDCEGEFQFCFRCGELKWCGCCDPDPACNDDDSCLCGTCAAAGGAALLASEAARGAALEQLLRDKPSGRHVRRAQLMLAEARVEGHLGQAVDLPRARREILHLARDGGGYALAQFALSCLYESGEAGLFPVNEGAALEMMQLSAAQGHMQALMELGTAYKNGSSGLPVDKPKAAQLLGRAAAMNDPKAMCNLASMLLRGDGVPVDEERGEQLYLVAASKYGNANAQFMCWQLCQKQGATLQQVSAGLDMCRASALQGFPPAINALESMPHTRGKWQDDGGGR